VEVERAAHGERFVRPDRLEELPAELDLGAEALVPSNFSASVRRCRARRISDETANALRRATLLPPDGRADAPARQGRD